MEQHCPGVPGAELVSQHQHHPEQENESQASTIIIKDYTRNLDGKVSHKVEYHISMVLPFSVGSVAYSGRGESGAWTGQWLR